MNTDYSPSQLMNFAERGMLVKAEMADLLPEDCHDIYWKKTVQRLETFARGSADAAALVKRHELQLNGKTLKGWPSLAPLIESRVQRLATSARGAVIHGDMCFANILYDRLTNLFKFIDPRGSFGTAGIYGDPRYDVAKLMHSVDGGYDFLIHEMFNIQETSGHITLERFFPPTRNAIIGAMMEIFAMLTSRFESVKHPREGNRFANMFKTADPRHSALDSHTETRMGHGPVLAQVQIPLECFAW